MKKIIVMLFLILTVSIVISQKAYAVKIIKRGNLLIYNETPFANRTILRLFRNYWAKSPWIREQKAKALYYWVVKANFKVRTYDVKYKHIYQNITGCFGTASIARFFKPNKYTIRFNDYYYIIVNNHKMFISMKYADAKKILTDKKSFGFTASFFYRMHADGSVIMSCNHRFYRSYMGFRDLKKYLIEQTF